MQPQTPAAADGWDGYTCITCEKPIVTGQAVYTIATDEDLKVSQHWSCKEAERIRFTESLTSLKTKLEGAEKLLKKLKENMG